MSKLNKFLLSLLLLCLASLNTVPAFALKAYAQKEYLIDEKDSLNLIYRKDTSSTNYGKLNLLPNCNLYAPIIGEIKACDLSGPELEKNIEKELKILTHEDIDVELVINHTNIKISVIGAVNRPGSYPTNNIKTIYDAIASAGGFDKVADKRHVKLIRQYEDGHRDTYFINFPKQVFKAYDQGLGKEVYMIREGDIIWVPKSKLKQAGHVLLSAAKVATIGVVSGVISASIND